MAIKWTRYNTQNEVVKEWTTHEGLVLTPAVRKTERVMSDIWADVSTTQVWDASKGTIETVSLGVHFDLCLTFGRAEVDAPADIMAAAEAIRQSVADQIKAAREAAARERGRIAAEVAFHRPEKGKLMQVVRGRKVPKGTIGRVFWLDSPRNPSRVGLAVTERKVGGRYADVVWVDSKYLKNLDPAGPDYPAE